MENITPSTSPGVLQNGIPGNITQVDLTAGDWDVGGACYFAPTAAAGTLMAAGLSTTSGVLPIREKFVQHSPGTWSIASTFTVPTQRFNVAPGAPPAFTRVSMVAQANFSAGTVAATAYIWARRRR
jgi:hypothetical protein